MTFFGAAFGAALAFAFALGSPFAKLFMVKDLVLVAMLSFRRTRTVECPSQPQCSYMTRARLVQLAEVSRRLIGACYTFWSSHAQRGH